MLIINGSAEFMLDNGEKVKGSRYGINMFSNNNNLDEQLKGIENHLMARGWDNIEITDNGFIENIEDIEHDILMAAFKMAEKEGFSVVVNNIPL